MELMTLEEAIKRTEEVAKGNEKLAELYYKRNTALGDSCRELAAEHHQLAKWLKDYKRLLEQETVSRESYEHEFFLRKELDFKVARLEKQIAEQEPCEDAISRQDAIKAAMQDVNDRRTHDFNAGATRAANRIKLLPPVTPQPKTGHCKDCKWWKDSDGVYRRGVEAESRCPINCREVFEGNGYCFLYEPKVQAEGEGEE